MKQSQQQSRRNFLSKIPFLGALSLMPSLALSNVTSEETSNKKRRRKDQAGKVKLSIFQTTDVHCQIHPLSLIHI